MTTNILIERFALGEQGALHAVPIPWADLVGPNSGLLEALYRVREGVRPLEQGDIVRVPTVGRFVVLAHGWAFIPLGWRPPLDAHQFPLPDEHWVLPAETRIVQPATDHPDIRIFEDRPWTRGGPPGPRPGLPAPPGPPAPPVPAPERYSPACGGAGGLAVTVAGGAGCPRRACCTTGAAMRALSGLGRGV